MKILNLEGTKFLDYWRSAGHNVLSIGPHKKCDIQNKKIIPLQQLWTILKNKKFFPDLIFWNDNCRLPSIIGFEVLPCPCIGFSIDQYCNPWHIPYSAAFDLILVAQKDYLSLFQEQNCPARVKWFPLFCNPEHDMDLKVERDLPISFVGTQDPPLNPQRIKLLREFKKKHPLYISTGDYVPVFARSHLVLNQSAAGELNYRIFQAAACGAAVLTEDTCNGLKDLFRPGVDILTYPGKDVAAAVNICKNALTMPQKLKEIALAGKDKVLKNHTVQVRAERILKYAENLIYQHSHQKRRNKQQWINKELYKCFMFIATDNQLPIPLAHRSFYAMLAQKYNAQYL